MTYALLYIVPVLFYLWYIASVRIYGAWETLDTQVKVVAGPSVLLFLVSDAVANLLLTIPFLDRPRELLITQRLTRYMEGPEGWRRRVATGICNKFLDPFDPTGKHCK